MEHQKEDKEAATAPQKIIETPQTHIGLYWIGTF